MPVRTPRFKFASHNPKQFDRKPSYGGEWRRLREQVLSEEPLCRHCAAEGRVTAAVEVDHIIPLFRGGRHERSNCQPLCLEHHREKTRRDMDAMR